MRETLRGYGWIKLLLVTLAFVASGLLGACQATDPPIPAARRVPPRQVPDGNASAGPAAIQKYGCGSCHTIPGVAGADSLVAPPLIGYAERAFVGGVVPNNPDNLIQWIQNPQSINPESAMPALGVTDAEARDIAAYLYTLR